MLLKFSNQKFPGILITFCGLDGTGKTTLISQLINRLESLNYQTYSTFQPSREIRQTEIFRRFVDTNDHEGLEYRSLSLLTVSDRVQHTTQVIMPRLRNGECVISDRYYYSALVNLRARGYKQDKWIYEIAAYLPKPDLPFFLDIDFDLAMQRIRQRYTEKNRWIDHDFNKSLHKEFRFVCKNSNGIRIDSSGCPEITLKLIWDHVECALKKKNSGLAHAK